MRESHGGLARQGVRPGWMFCAARECQVLAGTIALKGVRPTDVRPILCAGVPPVANELERYVLEGLIARSEREIEERRSDAIIFGSGSRLAVRAARILGDRHAEPWTIPLLARELGTNRFRLTTEFREALGVTVHQYLVQCRVEAAERLIQAGEKIEAAAYAVGFRSKKTLYSAFRKCRGTLPTAARDR
jgi:AraC-like DNA-binding protein